MNKYSELMLDVACGDASDIDAYIEEAKGKINVSNAIFALECSIVNDECDSMCIQEAAEAGLPTDKEGATGVSCEAVKQQLIAFYDLINNTAVINRPSDNTIQNVTSESVDDDLKKQLNSIKDIIVLDPYRAKIELEKLISDL